MDDKIPVITNDHYKNPVPFNDKKNYTNPDPYVIKWCGTYYCYSSHDNGVQVSTSADLVNWEYNNFALVQDGYNHYWAPSVIYNNGVFYMYYSNEENSVQGGHYEFLKLAISDNPLGPFVYKKTFFNKFSIDAHPMFWNGNYYLYYSPNDLVATDQEFAGTSIVVDRLIDMETLEGRPKPVVVPSSSQEIFARNRFNDGRNWHTIEGAVQWQDQETCYMLYSANAYINEDYYVGYSTASPTQDLMDMNWKKYPRRRDFHHLLKRNDIVEGTGHNTIAKAPNLVDDWIVYHGRDALVPITPGTEEREMRIDRILYDEKEMIIHGPSYEEQDAPQKANISIDELLIENDRQLYSIDNSLYYKAQVWLMPEHSTDGAKYSFILNHTDGSTLELQFHSGLNSIKVISVENYVRRTVAETLLPRDYNHFVFHQLDVEKSFDRYIIYVDTQKLLTVEGLNAIGEIGLKSSFCSLKARGLTVTNHCSLFKEYIYKLGNIYNFDQDVWFENDELEPNSENVISANRISYDNCFTERFTFTPLLKESSFTILSSGKDIFTISNLNEDSNVWIFKTVDKAWIFAEKTVHNVELSGDISLHLNGLAIKGYSYTKN